jgi:hypothetical protein
VGEKVGKMYSLLHRDKGGELRLGFLDFQLSLESGRKASGSNWSICSGKDFTKQFEYPP